MPPLITTLRILFLYGMEQYGAEVKTRVSAPYLKGRTAPYPPLEQGWSSMEQTWSTGRKQESKVPETPWSSMEQYGAELKKVKFQKWYGALWSTWSSIYITSMSVIFLGRFGCPAIAIMAFRSGLGFHKIPLRRSLPWCG